MYKLNHDIDLIEASELLATGFRDGQSGLTPAIPKPKSLDKTNNPQLYMHQWSLIYLQGCVTGYGARAPDNNFSKQQQKTFMESYDLAYSNALNSVTSEPIIYQDPQLTAVSDKAMKLAIQQAQADQRLIQVTKQKTPQQPITEQTLPEADISAEEYRECFESGYQAGFRGSPSHSPKSMKTTSLTPHQEWRNQAYNYGWGEGHQKLENLSDNLGQAPVVPNPEKTHGQDQEQER